MAVDASRLAHARDLLWVFLWRDLKSRYRRSVLGVLWSLIFPIVQLLVFGFLFKLVLGFDDKQVREATREVWTIARVESLLRDVRFGCRLFARAPGFSFVIVATLALYRELLVH